MALLHTKAYQSKRFSGPILQLFFNCQKLSKHAKLMLKITSWWKFKKRLIRQN